MEQDLIMIRESELKAKLARLQDQIVGIEEELEELNIAKGVLARLTGRKQSASPVASAPKKKAAKAPQKKPDGLPTIKELILEALTEANRRGLPGLAPKDIRRYVTRRYNYEMGSSANTVPSRMWRDEKIILKDTETGLFSLPSKEKPTDDNSLAGTSAGLFETPAKGREAGPGGGP